MISLLLAATLLQTVPISSKEIEFGNGTKATVEVWVGEPGTDDATAYLRLPTFRHRGKPISQCYTWSDIEWFKRMDGGVVLLIESYRFIEAYTITVTGKVYEHDKPWYSDSVIHRVSSRTARVIYAEHGDCEPAINAGAKLPEGKDYAIIAFDWAPKRQKWIPKVIGYE